MIFHLVRKVGFPCIQYTIIEDPALVGRANSTLGIARQRVLIEDKRSNIVYSLRQTNLLLKLISIIPFLGMIIRAPFYLYIDGAKCAKFKRSYKNSAYSWKIQDDFYELYSGQNETSILTRNEKQVATYQKNRISVCEKNEYVITLNVSDNLIPYYVLLCIFVDVTFYNNYRRWALFRYERTVVPKSK